VFHKDLGEINLPELDLNVREDRLLWESLYGNIVKGDLERLECRKKNPGCPQCRGRAQQHRQDGPRRQPTRP